MEYSATELKGAGTLNKSILEAGSDYTFFLYRPKNLTGQSPSLSGSGYFTFETKRDANGFYSSTITPYVDGAVFNPGIRDSVNTASFGVKSLVTSSYKFSYDLFRVTASGLTATSSFQYSPSVTSPVGSVFFRATGDYEMEISPETQACNSQQVFQQGASYPTSLQTILGTTTGTVRLNPVPFTIPDRWRVEWDGSEVIDTGYISSTVGAASYNTVSPISADRAIFTSSLEGLAAPEGGTYPLPVGGSGNNIILGDGYPQVEVSGSIIYSFNKGTAVSTADVFVYGPLPGTGWRSTLTCPAP